MKEVKKIKCDTTHKEMSEKIDYETINKVLMEILSQKYGIEIDPKVKEISNVA